MPYKREGSPFWWISLKKPDGTRIRQSSGTKDKEEAKAIEGRMNLEMWQQKTWGKTPNYTFEDVMTAYIKGKEGLKSLESTLASIKVLKDYFSNMTIASITREYVHEAMNRMRSERKYKPSSVSTRMATFRAGISFCKKELGWKIEDPSLGVKLPSKVGRVRWITEEEAGRLIMASQAHSLQYVMTDFIMLALNTGMRKNEILKLTWSQVDTRNKIVILDATQNKSGRTRSVPLNASALETLNRRRAFINIHCPGSEYVMAKHDGIRLTSPNNAFTEACLAARIKDFTIHDMRHTCASWLVMAGVPIIDVKEVLGHSSVKMTEKYAHLSPQRALDAVSKISVSKSQFGHSRGLDDTLNALKCTDGVGLRLVG